MKKIEKGFIMKNISKLLIFAVLGFAISLNAADTKGKTTDASTAVNTILNSLLDQKDGILPQVQQIPNKLKELENTAKILSNKLNCLSNTSKSGCSELDCSNLNSCIGSALADIVILLKAVTDNLLAEFSYTTVKGVETASVRPGILTQILTILTSIPLPGKIDVKAGSNLAVLVNPLNQVFDQIKIVQDKGKLIVAQIKGTPTIIGGKENKEFEGKPLVATIYKLYQFLNLIVGVLNSKEVVQGIKPLAPQGGLVMLVLEDIKPQDLAGIGSASGN